MALRPQDPWSRAADPVYRRYRGFVRDALRNYVDEDDLEDVTQDVFVVLLQKLRAGPPPEAVRAWLYQVLRRVAANHRRGMQRYRARACAGWCRPSGPDPECAVARREAEEFLARFLAELDGPVSEAFVLADVDGHSGREVAQRQGVKLFTAYGRIRNARRRLRRALAQRPKLLALWPVIVGSLRPTRCATSVLAAAVGVVVMVTALSGSKAPDEAPPAPAAIRTGSLQTLHPPLRVAAVSATGSLTTAVSTRLRSFPRTPVRERTAPRLPAVVSPKPPLGFFSVPPRWPTAKPRSQAPPGLPGSPSEGWLAGRVVDDRGHPLRGARIACRRRDAVGIRRRCGTASTTTDRNGRFRIGPVDPGRYELLAIAPGEATSGNEAVEVEVGAPVRLRM